MFNLKKVIIPVITLLMIQTTVPSVEGITPNIDTSNLAHGTVSVGYKPESKADVKVLIHKDHVKYTYNLYENDVFPLQLDNGKYTVSILENVIDNKYKVVKSEDVILQLEDNNLVYLQSNQIINWNENMTPIQKAKELTKDAKNDIEKVASIYSYIVKSIKYDNNKANSVQSDYIPSIESTFITLDGICYDYAALFAAMLRSVEVPTKLVMGRKNDISTYHAWNEVYLKDRNQWVTMDTTYHAALKVDSSNEMIKNSADYVGERHY